jgi:Zn-dependent M28 family amino/carboxypeptidase
VAALLEISRLFHGRLPARTLRFVAFTHEEPVFFKTEDMGSRVYARRIHELGENIVGMICLETIGYFNQTKGSQHYPFPLSLFYPDRGNFLAVIGNLRSRRLVRSFAGHFMGASDFPIECAALPAFVTGVDWSDHSSFWRYGYPAIMLTDTALYRYPWYHSTEDTADKVDYDALTRITHGIFLAVEKLVD